MESDFRSALVQLCRSILHPLIRILVRFGVSAGEFKSIVDSVYAQAGTEYLESNGERATYSKLAIVTGINRAVLPALLKAPKDAFRPRSKSQLHRAARVLSGWYHDERFNTRLGVPAVLNIESGQGRSFKELCYRYSGQVYHQTLLSELIRLGAVTRVGKSRVRAVRREIVADGQDLESILDAGQLAGDLIGTLDYNLAVGPANDLPMGHYIGVVAGAALPTVLRQLERRTESALDQVETLLRPYRVDDSAIKEGAMAAIEVGAAMFAIRRAPHVPLPEIANRIGQTRK